MGLIITLSSPIHNNLITANVTGLGPDYIISGPRPELTLLVLRFKQEPFLSLM